MNRNQRNSDPKHVDQLVTRQGTSHMAPNEMAPNETRPPMDKAAAQALCRSVGATAHALMEVINDETTVIREGRPQAIEALQSDKIELSARYLREMTRLKRHADDVRTLAAEEVEILKPLTHELSAKLLENKDALADVLSVSERLIRKATMAAVAAQSGPSTYGSNGMVTQPPPQASAAISINQAT